MLRRCLAVPRAGLASPSTSTLIIVTTPHNFDLQCLRAQNHSTPSYRERAHELKRVPKSKKDSKSLRTAGTTPGSAIPLVIPLRSNTPILDPSHPAAGIPLRNLKTPKWTCPLFSLNAYPKALLSERDLPYDEHLPPYNVERYPTEPDKSRMQTRGSKRGRVDFSMQTTFFNKWVEVDAVRRSVMKRKLKHAVELIVTKGANSGSTEKGVGRYGEAILGSQKVVFDENDAGEEKWLIPDYTYVFIPKNQVFLMPFQRMIELVREALVSLQRQAVVFEAKFGRTLQYPKRNEPPSPQTTVPPLLPVPPAIRPRPTTVADPILLAKHYRNLDRKVGASNYVAPLTAFGHGSLSEFALPSPAPLKNVGRPSSNNVQWRKRLVWERGFGEWTLRPRWKKCDKEDKTKIAATQQKMSARQRTPGKAEKHRTFRLRKVPVRESDLSS